MAKRTRTQPIPIGTATGESDHRTNTGQLQQTTTLRICRADPDPPRADGLLCRIVGPAFRPRTTHKHRIGNDDSKHYPVKSGRKADMVPHLGWVASNHLAVDHVACSTSQHCCSFGCCRRHRCQPRCPGPQRSPSPLLQKTEGLQQGLLKGVQTSDRKQPTPSRPSLLPQLFPAVRTHGFTDAPARHRRPSSLDGSGSPVSPRHANPC